MLCLLFNLHVYMTRVTRKSIRNSNRPCVAWCTLIFYVHTQCKEKNDAIDDELYVCSKKNDTVTHANILHIQLVLRLRSDQTVLAAAAVVGVCVINTCNAMTIIGSNRSRTIHLISFNNNYRVPSSYVFLLFSW